MSCTLLISKIKNSSINYFNLLFLGEKWFHQRRLLTPAFHFQVLEQFTEVMNEKADILNECIKRFVETNANESLDVFAFASKFTLDVICETAMGVDMDAQRKPPSTYSTALHKYVCILDARFGKS